MSLPFGIAVAWLLARGNFRGKFLIDAVVHIPLVVPPVAIGYLLLVLLGRRGPVGGWLYDIFGVTVIFTWQGAVVASAVMAFPLMVRAIRLSIEGLDKRLETAARTLGATPVDVFVTITLPLIAPGILTGVVLAFARSIGGVRRHHHLRLQHRGRDPDAAARALLADPAAGRRGGRGEAAGDLDRAGAGGGGRVRVPGPARRAAHRRRRMIEVDVRSRLGDFALDARFARGRRADRTVRPLGRRQDDARQHAGRARAPRRWAHLCRGPGLVRPPRGHRPCPGEAASWLCVSRGPAVPTPERPRQPGVWRKARAYSQIGGSTLRRLSPCWTWARFWSGGRHGFRAARSNASPSGGRCSRVRASC